MGDLCVRNAVLFPGKEKADIYVKNGVVSKIRMHAVEDTPVCGETVCGETVDAHGMTAVPGFANMHTHAAMTAVRGAGEDMPLKEWLDAIWKIESKLSPELIYWGTRLACLEMIKTGTTLFNDQYWMIDNAARAVADSGIRANLSYVFLDQFDRKKSAVQRDECASQAARALSWQGKIDFGVAVHSVYTVSEESLDWAGRFACKNGLKIHLHLSETETENSFCREKFNRTPAEHLEKYGLLTENTVAAHSLHLTGNDIKILGKNKVCAVHNVNSNLKLASGYKFMYKELAEAGARIALGTDGCASSNNLDMREAMKTTAILQKAWRKDPAAMPLPELMHAASGAGYEYMGLDGGAIAEGKIADFMLVDTSGHAFVPGFDFMSDFVYAADSSCIDTVVCGGDVLMRGHKVKDEGEIIGECRKIFRKLI